MNDYRAVVTENVLAAKVVQDGWTVGDSVTAAQHQVLGGGVGDAEAWSKLLEVPVLEGSAVLTSRAVPQKNQRARNIVCAWIGRRGIKPGLAIESFRLGERQFPAQPDIERQLGGGPPVVLHEESKYAGTIARLGCVNRSARSIRGPEEPTREGVAGGARKPGQRGFLAVEIEGARLGARFIGVVSIPGEVSAEFPAVPAVRRAESVL